MYFGPETLTLPPENRRERIAGVINEVITPELLLNNLKRLQEPAAPSGTELLTRTPVLREMLLDTKINMSYFDESFLGSESPALWMGGRRRLAVANFQLDDISYLPQTKTNEMIFPLRANCAHRQQPDLSFDGAVLRYLSRIGVYDYVSTGKITTNEKGIPYYQASVKPKDGFDPVIDRVVYTPTFNYDPGTNLISGKIDGPASVAVGISAAKAIQQVFESFAIITPNFGMVFAGEEEGIPGDNTMFAHGARMITSNMETTKLPGMVFIVDGHDIDSLPPKAVWGEQVSDGKGKVVAPHQAAPFRDFLEELKEYGVDSGNTWELGGTLSRSDDIAWKTRVKNVIPFGYPGKDFHFVRGIPTTNLNSLVNLAKGVTWIAVSTWNS